jgi:nuclear-control-of-ATPase protein 2
LATSWLTLIQTAATAPLALTRQECTLKRDALLGVRDERAKVLGELLSKQVLLDRYVKAASSGDAQAYVGLTSFSKDLQTLVDPQGRITQGNNDLIGHLSCLATYSMVAQRNSHSSHIQAHGLLRPSALTRAWPRLLIIPPLALYAIKQAYGSQEALAELAATALDTADRFWHDWILEPLRGVIKTIRAGSEEGMIINAKGVAADIDVSDIVSDS